MISPDDLRKPFTQEIICPAFAWLMIVTLSANSLMTSSEWSVDPSSTTITSTFGHRMSSALRIADPT